MDALGNTALLGRDSVGRMVRDRNARGYTTYFNYGPATGFLGSHVSAEGDISYFGYDSFGSQTRTVSPRWTETGGVPAFTTYYVYDQLGRTKKVVDPLGGVTYFEWTLRGDLMAQVDARGTDVEYAYNGLRLLTRETVTENSGPVLSDQFQGYDTYKNRTRAKDPRGNASYYFYDDVNRLTARMDALGRTEYFFYDAVDNVASRKDRAGNPSYFFYDPLSRLTVGRDAVGNASYFFYDLADNRTALVDPKGHPAYFFYDALDRVTAIRDALGFPTYFFYDEVSNRTHDRDARGNTTYFFFDGEDRMKARRDMQGNWTYFAYDAAGNLTRATDARSNARLSFYDALDRRNVAKNAAGDATYFFYDSVENVTHIRDARGNATYFAHDGLNRLVRLKDAAGGTAYFGYDGAGNRTALQTHVPSVGTTYYVYDALNQLTQVLNPIAGSLYLGYDANGNLIRRAKQMVLESPGYGSQPYGTTPYGGSTAVMTYFGYDAANRLVEQRDIVGGFVRLDYDAAGNVAHRWSASQNHTYFTYDALSRLTTVQDALGKSTYFEYDAVSNLTKVLDPRQNAAQTRYDSLDRPDAMRYADGGSVYFFYDGVSNRTKVVNGRGNATYFGYDAENRVQKVANALWNATYFFYDPVGNASAVRNALGHPSYFGYDGVNRLTRVQDTLGQTTYFEFDTAGNPTKILDPNGNSVQTRFDILSRPDAIRNGDGGSAYYFYDLAFNRTKHVNPRGHATYFAFDTLERPVRIQDALARTLYFEYDLAGNLSKQVGAEGESGANTHDALDRRTNITYTAAGSVVSAGLRVDPYFVYDEVGNLAQMGDLWGLHRWGHDSLNRPLRHQYPYAQVVYFEYDVNSSLTALVYPGTAGRATAAYDALDRQQRLQAPTGAHTTYFEYNAVSNLTRKVFPNNQKLFVTYDDAERVARFRFAKNSGQTLSYFDYSRDSKGLVTKVFREATHTVYYRYDGADRLVAEIWSKSGTPEVYGYRYAYDTAGNRIRARMNGADTYYFYDQANQLTVKGTNAAFASPSYYSYDKNGALTDLIEPSGTTKYAYNPAGRVARIKWRDATASYFFYDGQVRPYALIANGTLNYFLWEGTELVEELNAGGTAKDRHTHGASQIPGIGQLVQTFRPAETSANQRIYPVMDARGSITKWHKSDGTTVLASREYDAFGQIIPNSATGTWPNRFGYQGQYWMEILSGNGSQKLYLSDRPLYDPVDGRFLQNEPLLERRPFAQYLYAMQNPVRFVDPLGLQEKELITFPECKGKKGDGCGGGSQECKCPEGYRLIFGCSGEPICILEGVNIADLRRPKPSPQQADKSQFSPLGADRNVMVIEVPTGTEAMRAGATPLLVPFEMPRWQGHNTEGMRFRAGDLFRSSVLSIDTGGGQVRLDQPHRWAKRRGPPAWHTNVYGVVRESEVPAKRYFGEWAEKRGRPILRPLADHGVLSPNNPVEANLLREAKILRVVKYAGRVFLVVALVSDANKLVTAAKQGPNECMLATGEVAAGWALSSLGYTVGTSIAVAAGTESAAVVVLSGTGGALALPAIGYGYYKGIEAASEMLAGMFLGIKSTSGSVEDSSGLLIDDNAAYDFWIYGRGAY